MDCRNVRHWRLQSRSGLRASAGWPPNASAPARVPQACQDASHIGKAADNARHRIVGMNLILQIDEALVLYRAKSFKNPLHGHDAVSHRHLTILALEARQVLHVNVKQPRACFADRLNHIRAGTNRMPDIDAAPDARIHTLYRLQYIQRRMPQLIFWPVIVNREMDIVFLYELLNSRQSLRRRVAGDNNRNTRPLAVFELVPDVRIFIFREIDGSGSVQPDSCCGIVRQCRCLLLRIRREMIFDVLRIQREHIQLLHEADHLRAMEVTERVAGHAQMNRRCFISGWPLLDQCEDVARSSEPCPNERTGANEIATRVDVFHERLITPPENACFFDRYPGLSLILTRMPPAHLRPLVPSPSRTRVPTSSSPPGRPVSARPSCPDATRG